MRSYTVAYKLYISDMPNRIYVLANNAKQAYRNAMDKLDWLPYSAWVESVTYRNGSHKRFNNFEGKSY